MTVDDKAVEHVTGQPSSLTSKMAILDLVIVSNCSNAQLLDICSILESIIEDKEKVAQVVEPLRIGERDVKFVLKVHVVLWWQLKLIYVNYVQCIIFAVMQIIMYALIGLK